LSKSEVYSSFIHQNGTGMQKSKRLKDFKILLSVLHLLVICTSLFAQQKDSVYASEMKLPGVKMIPVLGKFKVWTRKMGNGPIKVLLLHGGPGNTHEYLQSLADSLASHGIEVYLYDQLGSYFSDAPDVVKDDTIWKMPMRVQELEDVRKGLGLDHFYLYGHSYGAALGLAYTHRYPKHIKGYIYSSMNTDFISFQARYGPYVDRYLDSLMRADTVGQRIMKNKDNHLAYDTASYQHMTDVYFRKTFLAETTTTPAVLITMKPHNNYQVAGEIQSHLFQSPENQASLGEIKTPILLIAGDHDFTASPKDIENIHRKLINSRFYIVANSGHMSMLDEPGDYDYQVLKFLTEVDTNKFLP